jgi:hypothetical protein
MVVFGDFGQLLSVGDIPLFDPHQLDGISDQVLEVNNGRDAYLSLTENITLNRLMRQWGEDDDVCKLCEALR